MWVGGYKYVRVRLQRAEHAAVVAEDHELGGPHSNPRRHRAHRLHRPHLHLHRHHRDCHLPQQESAPRLQAELPLPLLAERLFGLASAKRTRETNRKHLYALQVYPKPTLTLTLP